MDIARTSGDADEPAKIVLHLRARRGANEAVKAWIGELVQAAHGPHLQGSSVLTVGTDEHIVLLRFSRTADLQRWEASPDVERLLRRGEGLTERVEPLVRRTGLETWFTLPDRPAPAAPPATWKMALVTWLALMPQIIALKYVLPASWPMLLGVAVSTAIPVSMLSWVVMPRLTRLLYRWLYPAPAAGGVAP